MKIKFIKFLLLELTVEIIENDNIDKYLEVHEYFQLDKEAKKSYLCRSEKEELKRENKENSILLLFEIPDV